MSGPVGAWSEPLTAARRRKDWFPAPHSACPTHVPAWRWTASSARGKVGTTNLDHLVWNDNDDQGKESYLTFLSDLAQDHHDLHGALYISMVKPVAGVF